MGMKNNPDDRTISEVFAELDEDGSDDISIAELKQFLKRLFIAQKEEVAKALGKKWLVLSYDLFNSDNMILKSVNLFSNFVQIFF